MYFVVASFEAFRWGVFPRLALLLPGGLDDVELRKKKSKAQANALAFAAIGNPRRAITTALSAA